MVTHGCGADIYNLSRYEMAQNQFFPQMSERIVGFYLAPMAVPMLLPVHLLPLQHSFFLWFVFLLICTLASIFLLVKGLQLSLKSALMIWAFICINGPVFESLRIGQIGPVLLLSYSAFILCERLNRPWLSAIALLPFLCKPHLLLPQIAFLAGGRRYRELIVLVSMALVLLLGAFYMIGFEGLNSYYGHVQTNLIVQEHITPTLRDQVRLLFPAASSLMNTLSLPVYLLVLLYLFRQARVAGDSIFERSILVSMPAALLFSPYVHVYDWLLLTPSVIVFFCKRLCRKTASSGRHHSFSCPCDTVSAGFQLYSPLLPGQRRHYQSVLLGRALLLDFALLSPARGVCSTERLVAFGFEMRSKADRSSYRRSSSLGVLGISSTVYVEPLKVVFGAGTAA